MATKTLLKSRPVAPLAGMVLPLSEARTVPERRTSLGSYSSAASASTKHPFRDNGSCAWSWCAHDCSAVSVFFYIVVRNGLAYIVPFNLTK